MCFIFSHFQVTVKVLQSLAYGLPIVSPDFFDAYIKCARENSQHLPSVADFVPEITEPYIIKEPHMMAVHLDRQRLFQNKTFVFMVKHHMERFEPIISLAAGKCVSMDTDKVKKAFLCKPECIPVNYVPSSNTQSSSDIEGIVAYIQSKSRRPVNESEIGLAILHRSIDRFCNPDRKLVTDFERNSAMALNTRDILKDALISATPQHEDKDQPAPSSNPNPNSDVIPESADLSGTEPNNNRSNTEGDGSNKPSPRKSSRLSSRNVSTNLPDQLMPPPRAPKQQSPASTSKQQQKRKHAEQTSPPKSVGSEPMEQEQAGGPSKKQKTNDNDSGENSSTSAPIVDPLPPASGSASQQSDFNFSGFISTQNRRNRTHAAGTSQTTSAQSSRVLVQAKESRKRAVDLLNDDSDDEKNADEDNEKTFNFNRKAKRAKTTSKQGTQAKRRGLLDDNNDDDEDDTFNFSRKRNSERTSQQAKRRKQTEDELNNDDDVSVVDAATAPSQNTYKMPFQQMNRSLNRTFKSIELVPAPKCSADWITRKIKDELNLNEPNEQQSSSSVKVKVEKLEEWEMTDEEKKRQWIKSMANVFSIRKIDVNLSRSRYAADETDNTSANDVLNNTKNFKKFVKVKHFH